MNDITRRDALLAGGTGAVALSLAAAPAVAQAPVVAPAFAGRHQPKPLRFDPAKLSGLSERLIKSHWENNYQGSVRALNTIEQRLAGAMADKDFPALVYGDLKREELHRTGSVVLHELYFEQLGGNGARAGSVARALAVAFGDAETWEADFRRTAMSLAGGSGWTILAYNRQTKTLHNYWSWDHMHSPAGGVPLLALDMYEHSYHMDFGTQAAKYVDAFMANLDWEVIEARYQAAVH
jgi:superoxide dismutase, Fe-Mn family